MPPEHIAFVMWSFLVGNGMLWLAQDVAAFNSTTSKLVAHFDALLR
jgi:hypothetical protein